MCVLTEEAMFCCISMLWVLGSVGFWVTGERMNPFHVDPRVVTYLATVAFVSFITAAVAVRRVYNALADRGLD